MYFQTFIPLYIFFCEKGKISQDVWLNSWQSLEASEYTVSNSACIVQSMENLRTRFELNQIYLIAERMIEDLLFIYVSVTLTEGQNFFCEIRFGPEFSSYVISTRSKFIEFIKLVSDGIQVVMNKT